MGCEGVSRGLYLQSGCALGCQRAAHEALPPVRLALDARRAVDGGAEVVDAVQVRLVLDVGGAHVRPHADAGSAPQQAAVVVQLGQAAVERAEGDVRAECHRPYADGVLKVSPNRGCSSVKD